MRSLAATLLALTTNAPLTPDEGRAVAALVLRLLRARYEAGHPCTLGPTADEAGRRPGPASPCGNG